MLSTIDRTSQAIKSKILRLLSRHPQGLTITETSKHSALNYMTVSKYLAILQAEDKVDYIRIGMAKLFKPKRRGKKK